MDLVRDLLDEKLVDRNGREMGRVDSIVLEIRDDGPPRVAALEAGLSVLASRLHPRLGRWVAALGRAFGVQEGRPLRISFGDVLDMHDGVKVDLAVGETAAATVERRLRLDRLLGRPVLGVDGRRIGRLEEVRAEKRGKGCVVTGYVIGAAGLLERLGLGARLLFGIGRTGYVAAWDALDLSDPAHPRLTCPVEKLRAL